ncbi:Dephospho-CoA kinase domain-containing protein [Taenia crassiceps]|uniref:Dephospho-CoA kinase domain-containing protein n=1 Tax=Taenia crassiceps TaxID=6207 RepID=A0ABR4QAL5_9CEST
MAFRPAERAALTSNVVSGPWRQPHIPPYVREVSERCTYSLHGYSAFFRIQRSLEILFLLTTIVFNEDGTRVERDKLGEVVFSDPGKRKVLNRIVHPVVFRRIGVQILRNFLSGQAIVVLDIPLLFETRTMLWFLSDIIVVSCSPEVQLSRLLKRNPDLSRDAALSRIAAQMPLSDKVARATIVVDNEADGNFAELAEQVDACLKLLLSKAMRRFRLVVVLCTCALVGLAVVVHQFIFL